MHQLEIIREFNVPVTRLYEAWTKPEIMGRWFAPGDRSVHEVSANPVVGGEYRVVMKNSMGELYTVGGTYREIEANRKLVFTWRWQDSPHQTLVELDFEALSEQTAKLLLRHSEFVNEDFCTRHNQGWLDCLDSLAAALAD